MNESKSASGPKATPATKLVVRQSEAQRRLTELAGKPGSGKSQAEFQEEILLRLQRIEAKLGIQ